MSQANTNSIRCLICHEDYEFGYFVSCVVTTHKFCENCIRKRYIKNNWKPLKCSFDKNVLNKLFHLQDGNLTTANFDDLFLDKKEINEIEFDEFQDNLKETLSFAKKMISDNIANITRFYQIFNERKNLKEEELQDLCKTHTEDDILSKLSHYTKVYWTNLSKNFIKNNSKKCLTFAPCSQIGQYLHTISDFQNHFLNYIMRLMMFIITIDEDIVDVNHLLSIENRFSNFLDYISMYSELQSDENLIYKDRQCSVCLKLNDDEDFNEIQFMFSRICRECTVNFIIEKSTGQNGLCWKYFFDTDLTFYEQLIISDLEMMNKIFYNYITEHFEFILKMPLYMKNNQIETIIKHCHKLNFKRPIIMMENVVNLLYTGSSVFKYELEILSPTKEGSKKIKDLIKCLHNRLKYFTDISRNIRKLYEEMEANTKLSKSPLMNFRNHIKQSKKILQKENEKSKDIFASLDKKIDYIILCKIIFE